VTAENQPKQNFSGERNFISRGFATTQIYFTVGSNFSAAAAKFGG